MKEVVLPEPALVVGRNAEGKPAMVQLSLPRFLRDNCWCHPYWRDGSSEKREVLLRLIPKFDLIAEIEDDSVNWKEPAPGTKVRISDRDWKILCESLLFKGEQIRGDSAFQIMSMICSITDAKSVDDEVPVEDPYDGPAVAGN